MRTPAEGRRLALLVEYDGTRFAGFQIQPGARTVQGELARALERLTGEHLKVEGASRTDAGAHARMQVVAFTTRAPYPPETFLRALNYYLPGDIRVYGAYEVPPGFDPRRGATSREYCYLVWNHPAPPALWRRFAYHLAHPLDLEAMARALPALMGVRDFAPFSGPLERPGTTVRRMLSARVARRGRLVVLALEANAFLPGQVRRTAGALLQVGMGRLSVEGFWEMARCGRPGVAGPALPPHGLVLARIRYPDFPPQGEGPAETGPLCQ